MLRRLVEEDHFLSLDHCNSWEEAIITACQLLEKDGTVDSCYAAQIIDCVRRYGPYIMIMPNVCLAHSQENAEGVHRTGLALLRLAHPVLFDSFDGEDYPCQLIFALSASNPELHLQNVVALSDLLSTEGMAARLAQADSPEALLHLQETYLDHLHKDL